MPTFDFTPNQPTDHEPDHFEPEALTHWSDEDWEDWVEDQRWLGTDTANECGDIPPYSNPLKDLFG